MRDQSNNMKCNDYCDSEHLIDSQWMEIDTRGWGPSFQASSPAEGRGQNRSIENRAGIPPSPFSIFSPRAALREARLNFLYS